MCWETKLWSRNISAKFLRRDFPRFLRNFPRRWSSAKNPPHLLHRHRSALYRPSIPSVEKNATPISKAIPHTFENLLERPANSPTADGRKQEILKGSAYPTTLKSQSANSVELSLKNADALSEWWKVKRIEAENSFKNNVLDNLDMTGKVSREGARLE